MKKLLSVILIFIIISGSCLPTMAQEDYPTVTKEQISQLLTKLKNEENHGHPYLFARKKDFDRVANLCDGNDANGEDEFLSDQYFELYTEATRYLATNPQTINADLTSQSYIGRGFDGWRIVMVCAFVYRISGDEAYAKRAYDEADYFADMNSWGTYQYIDNNQAAFAVALCYDWLYDWLSDIQKQELSSALCSKHLNTVKALFDNPADYSSSFYQAYFQEDNHAVLDNSATFVEALAIADCYDGSAEIMVHTLKNLEKCFNIMKSDGAWYEGVGYWSYVGPFLARMFSAMESAFGTTFGYENLTHITHTGYFPIYMQSSQGEFVYSDSNGGLSKAPEKFYFGKMIGDEALQKYTLDENVPDCLLSLWYDPTIQYNEELTLPLDKKYDNIDAVTMRSTWNGKQEIFTGFEVQNANMAHAFMNSGTFVLDALGERWISNPGKDDYSLDYWDNSQSGSRWNYYVTRAEANSCMVINPSHEGGQKINANDDIDVFSSGEGEAFAIADLTATYGDYVTSYKRGLRLYDDRTKVMLRDEAELKQKSEVYSFVNIYRSSITLSEDKKSAIISKGNKKLLMSVICDAPYELSVMEAKSLPTSPQIDGQKKCTTDFQRISIHFEEIESLNMSIVFEPYLGIDNTPQTAKESSSLDEWCISSNKAKPKLTSLMINAEPIEGFHPDKKHYEVFLPNLDASINATSSQNTTVTCTKNTDQCSYTIKLKDNAENESIYFVELHLRGSIEADTMIGGCGTNEDLNRGENYASRESVIIKSFKQYSTMAYYKIGIPFVPKGRRIDSLTLSVHQYQITDSKNRDTLGFYLLDEDAWQENEITYDNAPIRCGETNTACYPYNKKGDNGSYSQYATEDMTLTQSSMTASSRQGGDSRLYRQNKIDLTPLFNSSGKNAHSKDANVISFAIGVTDLQNRSNSYTYIASKENSNAALRPHVFIKTVASADITASKPAIYIEGKADIAALQRGDKLSCSSLVENTSDTSEDVTMFFAQYNTEGELVMIDTIQKSVASRENSRIKFESISVSNDTDEISVMLFDSSLCPLWKSKKINVKE